MLVDRTAVVIYADLAPRGTENTEGEGSPWYMCTASYIDVLKHVHHNKSTPRKTLHIAAAAAALTKSRTSYIYFTYQSSPSSLPSPSTYEKSACIMVSYTTS